MDDDIAKILISSEEIQAKVREIGDRLAQDYAPLGDGGSSQGLYDVHGRPGASHSDVAGDRLHRHFELRP